MLRRWSSVSVLIAAVWSVGLAAAQSRGAMSSDAQSQMPAARTVYTGCVEAGAGAGQYALTRIASKKSMSGGSPRSLRLMATAIDLGMYLNQKVAVTGMLEHDEMGAMEKGAMAKEPPPVFKVKSLRIIAARCS